MISVHAVDVWSPYKWKFKSGRRRCLTDRKTGLKKVPSCSYLFIVCCLTGKGPGKFVVTENAHTSPQKGFLLRPSHPSGNSCSASYMSLCFSWSYLPPPGNSNPFCGEVWNIFWNCTIEKCKLPLAHGKQNSTAACPKGKLGFYCWFFWAREKCHGNCIKHKGNMRYFWLKNIIAKYSYL